MQYAELIAEIQFIVLIRIIYAFFLLLPDVIKFKPLWVKRLVD